MTNPTVGPKVATRFNQRQKVDATIRLIIDDPALRDEDRILRKLLNTARRTLARPAARQGLKTKPSLYRKYRGNEFPLTDFHNHRIPRWRNLSPWMKTQLAALCLGERRLVQIRLHLHEELRGTLGDESLKEYIRDRLMRCLRARFDPVPWFYIVIEDRDSTGRTTVRPHVHGAIAIPRAPVPTLKNGSPRARFARIAAGKGVEEAEYVAGRMMIDAVLKQATGNDGRKPAVSNGRTQASNVWKRSPYRPLFNEEWVSYALKNMKQVSATLPENRLSMSRSLNQEARRLWNLIRDGEAAIDQWP